MTIVEHLSIEIFNESHLERLCKKLIETSPEEFPYLPKVDYDDMYKFWSTMLKHKNFMGVHAFIKDELIGVINGELIHHPYNKDFLIGKEITWWVAKEHRTTGIGKILFDEFENVMKLNGAKSLMTSILHKDPDLSRKLDSFYLRKNYKVFETYYIKDI